MAEFTALYHKRLQIWILSNDIRFITDIRNWEQWIKEFGKHGEATVMEDMGEDYVMSSLIQRMKDYDMDEEEIRKTLITITGREVDLDNYC